MILQHRVKYFLIAVVTVWGIAVASGALFLEVYAARPGVALPSPDRWPEGTAISRDGRRPTLLVFLHPRCPCSLASLDELAEILKRCGDRVSAQAVVLDTPLLESSGGSAIDQALSRLPGIATRRDAGGAEARRFSVTTSGHLLLYDVEGRLVFSGGITAARGHRGDNFGRAALLGWIAGESPDRRQTCVFGCPLASPRSKSRPEARP
jgi:hypothetical protein